jgi:ribosomal-protein-alanine N-acetyltransferase
MFTQVAERPTGELAGYVFCREVAGESELLNLAVDPELRRGGVGRMLLVAAIDWLTLRGARETFLEVRASNAAAIALYEGAGFRAVGRRPGYYQRPPEDAILYRRPGVGGA